MADETTTARIVVAHVDGEEWAPPHFDPGAARRYLAVRSFEIVGGRVVAALDAWNRTLYSTRDGDDVLELAKFFVRQPALWHVAEHLDQRPGETVLAAVARRADELARGDAPRPKLEPGAWIEIDGKIRAVVCGPPSIENADLEVVWRQGHEAISEDVRWTGAGWEFAGTPQPGYADRSIALRRFVAQLWAGRPGDPPHQEKGRRR